jgi:hypothetical protein
VYRAAAVKPYVVAALASLALLPGCGGGSRGEQPPPGAVPNPLRFQAGAQADYERRATAGFSHVLYALSPGGVAATAARTAQYRPQIERAARSAHVDPGTIEALVFLESGGRPEVIAGKDPAAAAGLTQILASTGAGLLGMRVDLAESRRLTTEIARAEDAVAGAATEARLRAARQRVERLRAQRRAVDQRFDPVQALMATARYLRISRKRFRREDLAFVSYHMGIANLADVIHGFGKKPGDEGLPYARLYFDSTPLRHAAAYTRLVSFGDDSITYYWRLLAARQIMHLYRSDKKRLARQEQLQTAIDSAEEVLHPPKRTRSFADPGALASGVRDGELARLRDDPAGLQFARGPEVGALAPRLHAKRSLYWALRPAAVTALAYFAAGVHSTVPAGPPLTVTAAVRDRKYEDLLPFGVDSSGTLHTSGFSFDVGRNYGTHARAEAVQFMLDRLTAMNLVAWIRLPGVLHVTAAGDAIGLAPWLAAGTSGKLR